MWKDMQWVWLRNASFWIRVRFWRFCKTNLIKMLNISKWTNVPLSLQTVGSLRLKASGMAEILSGAEIALATLSGNSLLKDIQTTGVQAGDRSISIKLTNNSKRYILMNPQWVIHTINEEKEMKQAKYIENHRNAFWQAFHLHTS